VASIERSLDRGTRRGSRSLQSFGEEAREARIQAGLSQDALARSVGLSQSQLSRIERAKLDGLTMLDASRIASVLGLDLSVRAFPVGPPLRDAGHVERLRRLLAHVRAPLRYRLDVPLPQRPDQPTELRAWDAVLVGGARRTGIELETRLHDAQAMIRRHGMKRRDDPVDGFLLVFAATRSNRRIHAENRDLWPDLSRYPTRRALAALEAGEHPPSGIIFI
jgi:transcriptional regulator with XRE-family HTH domain